jgi:hypothetical protein
MVIDLCVMLSPGRGNDEGFAFHYSLFFQSLGRIAEIQKENHVDG